MIYLNQHRLSEFFLELEKFDMELAEKVHLEPCKLCGGRLDVANYYRKVRGIGASEPVIKFGLCCRKEGCRKRAPIESVRFLGGFIYCSIFVLLISALMNGDQRRFKNISRHFDLSARTMKRWFEFWDEIFHRTSFWKEHKGKVPDFFPLTQS